MEKVPPPCLPLIVMHYSALLLERCDQTVKQIRIARGSPIVMQRGMFSRYCRSIGRGPVALLFILTFCPTDRFATSMRFLAVGYRVLQHVVSLQPNLGR